MHEGDTVEILSSDDGRLVGKRGIIVAKTGIGLAGPYFAVETMEPWVGGERPITRYWTGGSLKLIETYEQTTAREIGDEYFA
jgi:hypothetical protein